MPNQARIDFKAIAERLSHSTPHSDRAAAGQVVQRTPPTQVSSSYTARGKGLPSAGKAAESPRCRRLETRGGVRRANRRKVPAGFSFLTNDVRLCWFGKWFDIRA